MNDIVLPFSPSLLPPPLSPSLLSLQVWWLAPQRRDWVLSRYPKLMQVTKTEDTSFKKFGEEKIKVVNDDWGTPLETVRLFCSYIALTHLILHAY